MKPAIWPLIVLLLVCSLAEASAASVTLAWDGVPGLLYKVYYGTKPGVYTQSVDAKERHSVVIDGLADNQVYYFAVRAYDRTGKMSPLSPEVRKVATPSPPADRKATQAPAGVPAAAERNATGARLVMPPPADRKVSTSATAPPTADRKEPPATATAPPPVDRKESPPATVPTPPPDPKTDVKTDAKADVKVDAKADVKGDANAADARKEPATAARVPPPPLPPPPVTVASGPPGYLIGPNDVLSVTFWRDKDMSAENVVVRPDGNITLPLLNDIQAAGSTPDQLRDRILAAAQRFLEDPSPTVAVKEIHSRIVFITGQVEKPGPFPLAGPMTVVQLIAMAGGLKEFADGKNIVVLRSENGRQVAYQVDYKELLKRKNLRQNIDLKPGDTVVVP